MSGVVISAEHVYKEYRLGVIGHRTLYRDVQSWWSRVRRKEDPNTLLTGNSGVRGKERFLALEDVSFSVNKGDVLGIIGRNGAGKSTLLKILSKVTSPSRGQVKLKGRVASLLEVGTGFHPELTGRENVFLNGAILGMTKKEIASRFDQIVAFSEIEKFIDTPVKRYSSGMYVRLAFAVAAHLEPEILIVDEVLAVGDIEFQKKCLGKMKDVSGQGRTVLFVSHNMGAVKQLCSRAILMGGGKILMDDAVPVVVNHYLSAGEHQPGEACWDENKAPLMAEYARIRAVRIRGADGRLKTRFDVKEPVFLEMEYDVMKEKFPLNVHFYLKDDRGNTLMVAMDNNHTPYKRGIPNKAGKYTECCRLAPDMFNEGSITVTALICTNPTGIYNVIQNDVVSFMMTDDMQQGGVRGDWVREWPDSLFRPVTSWEIKHTDA